MPSDSSTRSRIVAAANQLFGEHGYASTSLADVAAQAGVLKGNLAYYFPTRQALALAVIEERGQAWRSVLASLESRAPGDAIIALLEVIDAQAQALAHSGCPLGGLATDVARCAPEIAAPAARPLLDIQAFLTLRLSQIAPSIDPARAAERLLARLQGAAVLAHVQRDPAVVSRAVEDAKAWLADLA